jgi:hypothetical protein
MSRQPVLLKFFYEELEKPNPAADLEQKLLSTKAAAEKQIQALTRERDTLKVLNLSFGKKFLRRLLTLIS